MDKDGIAKLHRPMFCGHLYKRRNFESMVNSKPCLKTLAHIYCSLMIFNWKNVCGQNISLSFLPFPLLVLESRIAFVIFILIFASVISSPFTWVCISNLIYVSDEVPISFRVFILFGHCFECSKNCWTLANFFDHFTWCFIWSLFPCLFLVCLKFFLYFSLSLSVLVWMVQAFSPKKKKKGKERKKKTALLFCVFNLA